MRSIIRYLIPFGILVIWRKVYREIIRLISNYILVYRLNKYSKLNEILKLQLGCGKGLFDDWFNTDRTSKNNVSFLDVTLPFPIKDNYFDYIYSEHLIEHLEYHEGIHMIQECYRVLKPGGRIRIATPDLQFLINLCNHKKTPIEKLEIKRIVDCYYSDINIYDYGFVINNFFYNWEHKFIFNFNILKEIISSNGFVNIVRCKVGESNDKNLQFIESHGDIIGDKHNELQTFVIEAIKPIDISNKDLFD